MTAFAVIGLLLASACGPASSARQIPVAMVAPAQETISAPVATPSPAEAIFVQETVLLKVPTIEVAPPAGAEGLLWAALTAEGVDALTAIRFFDADLVTLAADRRVQVAAVDATAFRPFTPEATAQAPQVWQRLVAGDILVRHDIAHELGLALGSTVHLASGGTSVAVRVGAFASNGAPPIADIIVPWDLGGSLGHTEVTKLLVAITEGASSRKVQRAVIAALGGGQAVERQLPANQQAQLLAGGSAVRIEPFSYVDLGDGMITIMGSWVRDWIVNIELPRLGRVNVNRVIAPQLLAAFDELAAEGLLEQMDPRQFGGGWVPRHIDWNPARPLSMHAWGLAIDFNTRDNALGASPTMDPRMVAVFERWGFAWGGRWARPDGMHFELAKVVQPRE
jgi:hypothetical protein